MTDTGDRIPGTPGDATAGPDPRAGGEDRPTDPAPGTDTPPQDATGGAGGGDGAPEAAGGDAADVDLSSLEADIATVMRERDEYLDALQRLKADFDNYRKRIFKQEAEVLERAAESLVVKLLPVLDAFDRALEHDVAALEPVHKALWDVLAKEGLERIEPVGEPFDPSCHEAVAHEPDGDGGPVVVEVMRPGYRWKGRVIRPAMVKVKG